MTLYMTEYISLLSFCANYIKQAAHLCFGNNVTCYMSAISNITYSSRIIDIIGGQFCAFLF